MNDLESYHSYKEMLESFTEEERAEYWKRENRMENLRFINQMHEWIQVDKRIIDSTKRWLQQCVERFHNDELSEDKLKENLLLGAELIEGCEDSIKQTRAEIAHYTKYPLYSEKRRQWYNSKEGQQWLERVEKQLKRN